MKKALIKFKFIGLIGRLLCGVALFGYGAALSFGQNEIPAGGDRPLTGDMIYRLCESRLKEKNRDAKQFIQTLCS